MSVKQNNNLKLSYLLQIAGVFLILPCALTAAAKIGSEGRPLGKSLENQAAIVTASAASGITGAGLFILGRRKEKKLRTSWNYL